MVIAKLTNKGDVNEAEKFDQNTVAGVLAAGITVATATLGIYGGLTGSVARMTRNHPWQTPICFTLILLAVLFAIGSRVVTSHVETVAGLALNRIAILLSLLAFAAGLIWVVWLMDATLALDDRPTVSAKVTKSETGMIALTATAKAGGLAAQEPIYVTVLADTDRDVNTKLAPAFESVVGANQDGQVDQEFSVVLDARVTEVIVLVSRTRDVEDCPEFDTDRAEATACATVTMPDLPVTETESSPPANRNKNGKQNGRRSG